MQVSLRTRVRGRKFSPLCNPESMCDIHVFTKPETSAYNTMPFLLFVSHLLLLSNTSTSYFVCECISIPTRARNGHEKSGYAQCIKKLLSFLHSNSPFDSIPRMIEIQYEEVDNFPTISIMSVKGSLYAALSNSNIRSSIYERPNVNINSFQKPFLDSTQQFIGGKWWSERQDKSFVIHKLLSCMNIKG